MVTKTAEPSATEVQSVPELIDLWIGTENKTSAETLPDDESWSLQDAKKKNFGKWISGKKFSPQKLAVAGLCIPVCDLHERKANGHVHGNPLSEPVERRMLVVDSGLSTMVCSTYVFTVYYPVHSSHITGTMFYFYFYLQHLVFAETLPHWGWGGCQGRCLPCFVWYQSGCEARQCNCWHHDCGQ